jgi:O-antigen ligase
MIRPGVVESSAPPLMGRGSLKVHWSLLLGASIAVGFLTIFGPGILGIGLLTLLALALCALAFRQRMLGLLIFGLLLVGLYGGSRDFSYIGLSIGDTTLYISEITLGLTILLVLPTALRRLRVGDRRAFPPALLIYLSLGLISLIRGWPHYGLEALRDSALSYYALAFSLTVLLTPTLKRLWMLIILSAAGWFVAGLVVFYHYLMGVGVALEQSGLERYGAGGQAIACVGSVGAAIASWSPGVPRKARLVFGILAGINLLVGILFIQHRSLSIGILLVVLVLLRVCLAERSLPVTVVIVASMLILSFPLLISSGSKLVPPLVLETLDRLQTLNPSGSDPNIDWRVKVWEQTFASYLTHPIFGIGYGPAISADLGYRIDYDIDPHNSYLAILYRLGLSGLVAFFLLWAPILRKGYRKACSTPDARFRIGIALGVHLGIVVLAFFNVVLEGPYMGIPFWVSLAFIYQASELTTESSREPQQDESI